MKFLGFGAIYAVMWLVFPPESGAYFHTSPLLEEKPVSITMVSPEYFTGYTEGGYAYTQKHIVADTTVRIHKFTIADTGFYMSDRGLILAQSDIEAVSIYLSLT